MTAFMSGKNSSIVVVIDDKPLRIYAKTWEVSVDATIDEDDVCGEDRARFNKVINFYRLATDSFAETNALLNRLLEYDAKLDTNTGPFDAGFGLKIFPNDGTVALYTGRELSVDDWKMSSGERRGRKMFTLPIRMRYFEKAA